MGDPDLAKPVQVLLLEIGRHTLNAMNWPQSNFSSQGGSGGGGLFGTPQQQQPQQQQQQPSSSSLFGTPGQQQQQQQPQQQQGSLSLPSAQNQSNSFSGFGGNGTTSTSQFGGAGTPQHQQIGMQQQQHQQQQQQQPGGGQFFTSSYSHSPQPPQQNLYSTLPSYGQQSTFQQFSNASGSQQGIGQYSGYGSSSSGSGNGNNLIGGQTGPGTPSQAGGPTGNGSTGVGRYLPGYLTGSSITGSPRFNQSLGGNGGYESKTSPEMQTRELAISSNAAAGPGFGSSKLFSSTTSSSGTGAGKDSPSRSPRSSFGSPAYGSKNSLALTRGGGGGRSNFYSSSGGAGNEYNMDEDAPPTDTLSEFEDGPGSTSGWNGPSSAGPAFAPGPASSSKSPAPSAANLPGSSSSGASQSNGRQTTSSSSSSQSYKITVFGFNPTLLSSVLQYFGAIAPIVYNSSSDTSPSKDGGSSAASAPAGANWVTVGYENEWSALRALRRNGEVLGGNTMVGVKWASDGPAPQAGAASNGAPTPNASANDCEAGALVSRQQQQQQSTSTLGQPAMVLPASQAWLKKPAPTSAGTPIKSVTASKLNELARIDPKIFKQQEEEERKKAQGQNGGVVGTLTNLIFGF